MESFKMKSFEKETLDCLRGHWTTVVIATAVIMLIIEAGNFITDKVEETYLEIGDARAFYSPLCKMLILFFIILPLEMGYMNALQRMFVEGDYNLTGNTFRITRTHYLHNVAGGFFTGIKTIGWLLLFLVPSFIMCYAYLLTPYILHKHPEISAWKASTLSRKMMRGHKKALFMEHLKEFACAIPIILLIAAFLYGVIYLCFLALNIENRSDILSTVSRVFSMAGKVGMLWVQPYVFTLQAAYYEKVKKVYAEKTSSEEQATC